jgi:hypothetical protein
MLQAPRQFEAAVTTLVALAAGFFGAPGIDVGTVSAGSRG